MKKYLLPEGGSFYKANLHCHSVLSDGRLTPEELKELYKSYGYSVLAYTDHDIFIPHNDLSDKEFIALNGFEAEVNEHKSAPFDFVKTVHMCFIALDSNTTLQPCWHRTKYLFGNAPANRHLVQFDENEPDYERAYTGERMSDMVAKIRSKGFFATYNHPSWSRERYTEYMGYNGLDAMEIFNGACIVEGHDDYNPRVYEDMLCGGKRLFCIGADDNHNCHPKGTRRHDSGRAFTMIKAPELKYEAITSALSAGSFYASEAPLIEELYVEDGFVHITCSPADKIDFSCDFRHSRPAFDEDGSGLTHATFKIPEGYKFFRLTVTDKQGKRACTNAYFPDQITD